MVAFAVSAVLHDAVLLADVGPEGLVESRSYLRRAAEEFEAGETSHILRCWIIFVMLLGPHGGSDLSRRQPSFFSNNGTHPSSPLAACSHTDDSHSR